MKYFEYLYLILMIMALVFLANEWAGLATQGKVMLLVVTALFAFMFSFRRTQRIRLEKEFEEEMEKEVQDFGNKIKDNAE